MKKFWNWVKRYSSELIGAGLMLASSGLDGVYMALWMPARVPWLGFVLNTMADITDLYLGHRVGRLIRSKDATKRLGAIALFAGELVAVAYSWFFSWRQLLRILPAIEPEHYSWVAPLAAGFIPLLLAFLGIESGLTSLNSKTFIAEERSSIAPQPAIIEPPALACSVCGATHGKSGKPFLTRAAVSGHMSEHSTNGNGHKRLEEAKEGTR